MSSERLLAKPGVGAEADMLGTIDVDAGRALGDEAERTGVGRVGVDGVDMLANRLVNPVVEDSLSSAPDSSADDRWKMSSSSEGGVA